jgi:hypothetical protein
MTVQERENEGAVGIIKHRCFEHGIDHVGFETTGAGEAPAGLG